MAKEIDRHFVVMVAEDATDGDAYSMVADSAATYETFGAALLRAETVAASGSYAEVCEVVTTRALRRRVEP